MKQKFFIYSLKNEFCNRPISKVCTHKTHVMKEQPPFAYSLVLVNRDGVVLEEKTYVGEDAADNFVITALNIADKYTPILSPGVPMRLSDVEREEKLKNADKCHICQDELNEDRVLDHDHLNGDFLGVAHNVCNLRRREQPVITCFAHNFSGYDSHFLLSSFNRVSRVKQLQGIPLTTQKFKALYVNENLRFIDSFAFLSASLAKQVETLVQSDSKFPIFQQMEGLSPDPVEREDELKLLKRKGVYPYSFATSLQALQDCTFLPPREAFRSDFTGEECSDEDYAHALRVWKEFDCENMLEYTNIYVKADTFLLADAVVAFRDKVWSLFQLDMCQYLSLPHLAKDIMLKETGCEIDHMTDYEMIDLVRRNIRGGLSFVNLREAQAGQIIFGVRDPGDVDGHTDDWFDPIARDAAQEGDDLQEKMSELHRWILLYLDANNLYGWAMSQSLPMGDYEWMEEDEVADFCVERDVQPFGPHGYVLEVDLTYPKDLHMAHNSFPLAPETVNISWSDLSIYSRNCKEAMGQATRHSAKKLTATFNPRKKYLVHGENLKYYLRKGLRLDKIHRIIKFKQSRFIQPFIEKCTRMRSQAATKAEQDLWKLICNSLYGKFIESGEKRMDCRFSRTRAGAVRNATSPLYKSSVIFGEDFSVSFHNKKELVMNQSWLIGFTVLELSKLRMQTLFYDHIKAEIPAVSVIMSDTDSFLFRCAGRSTEETLEFLSDVMDFSNYPPTHFLHDSKYAKVPGLLKNEIPNANIESAVALKAKTYAIKASNRQLLSKAKGVTESVKRAIPFKAYKDCITR